MRPANLTFPFESMPAVKAHEVFRCLSLILVVAMTSSIQAQSPSIDGGLTWTGWTDKGLSNQLGVYASGSENEIYRVYSTSFLFNNNTRTNTGEIGGGPTGGTTGFGTGGHSAGAFQNGNTILGIGLKAVSGGQINDWTFVKFDLDNDSYKAASSVPGTDGRTSFSQWSETGDFTTSFLGLGENAWTGQEISIQVGNGTAYGGTSIAGNPGNNGGVSNNGYVPGGNTGYDFPFRAFRRGVDSFQIFYDITRMQTLYAGNGIGTFTSTIGISMQGFSYGSNNVAFSQDLAGFAPPPIPEPASLSAMAAGLTGLLLWRRRTTKS
jgi:hypothetical protein